MSYESELKELTKAKIRYLVAGAVGALLSGYVRLTADLDLLLDLSSENLSRLISLMSSRNYKPAVPVQPDDLLDPTKREQWHREKHMKVFTFKKLGDPFASVDAMIYSPIDFEDAWKRRQEILLDNTTVYVASLEDLITLKKDAIKNRNLPKDLYDLEALEELKRRKNV